MDTHQTQSHNIRIKCAGRTLFGCFYFVACVIAPLAVLWPAHDLQRQMTSMFAAAQHGNVVAIDEVLRGGLDVDCRDETGITPLMAAARAGQVDAVRKLLAAGARINACAAVWGTPLMLAASGGHHDVMRELIARGADVNAANPTGQTALWYARVAADDEAVRILIAAGAVAEGHNTPSAAGKSIAVENERSGR
jgi:ankyrin repeat protein